jgi:hypothetical protein
MVIEKLAIILPVFAFTSSGVAATAPQKGFVGGSGLEQSSGQKPDHSSEAGWVQAGFGNPKITKLDLYVGDGHRYTHETDLDIVLLRGSGWTMEIIEKRYRKVVNIYRQCNLKFSNMRVIEVDAPFEIKPPLPPRPIETFKVGSYWGGSSSGMLAERVPSPQTRIVSLHVSKIAGNQTGVAGIPATTHGTLLVNRVWISSAILSADRKEDHSLEAHEIGHILVNCIHGHRSARETADGKAISPCDEAPGNVMANGARSGSVFTENQCSAILRHGSIRIIESKRQTN